MDKQFTFQPDFWAGGKTQYNESDLASNPDGGLPDGSVVGRVHTRRNSGSDDFMAQLLQAIVQMQQSRETSAQRAAARRDPTAEANRLRQTPGTPEFNGMGPGGNSMVNGQLLGPITAGSGMTPEQIARMQGRTAANQWKFPAMFREIDRANVAGVVKEHNDGIGFIKQQQGQEVPSTDFRDRDPNMAGRYEGTNVRDFLLDQAARKAQDKSDDFDPAPAGTVRRIIPQARYGTTPGYATRPAAPVVPTRPAAPVSYPSAEQVMGGFNPEGAPAPQQQIADSIMGMFSPEAAPAPSPMAAFDPEGPIGPSPMAGFNPETAPEPKFFFDKWGTKTRRSDGQKFTRNGNATYGPQSAEIMEFFKNLF